VTIAEIIRSEPLSVHVFKKQGLDYFDSIDLEFETACIECAVNPDTVRKELIAIRHSAKRLAEPFNQFIMMLLSHHDSLKEKIHCIRHALDLANIHEHTFRYELLTIKSKFETMVEKLEIHLYKEEEVLFPEFLKLWHKLQSSSYSSLSFCLEYPIESLESEHESVIAILEEIKQLRRYYNTPQQATEYYQNVCNELDKLEINLYNLIRLENSKLFPEALALEDDMNNFVYKQQPNN
jgi:regulator of cell morphogenesis and NO signaling